MCITVEALNEKMAEIQSLKRLREETDENIKALEREVIDFLTENKETCTTKNSKGKDVLKFIGNVHKATYSETERETVDKGEVKKLLSAEDYQKVSKISIYSVLRIN